MKIIPVGALRRSRLLVSVGAAAILSLGLASTASAIVPNDNQTPEDIVDDEGGVNGVGMFFRSDGFVCTGTLINPRTVLFAAHCVNNRPETDYGTTINSAFSFGVNALPGFQNWISNAFSSNPDLFVYNISQIQYNPDSLRNPQALGFLEADIALATLDTPAVDIPTWALLFSPLPAPGTIDPVTGTGYHVNITGYGRTGNGTFGDFQGIDWRRRAAENMLGALASLDDRDTFLFGGASGLPQNLYNLDFDDPNQASPFDFNLFLDEPLENEATTAGGDSGGPLILDAANNEITDEDLVIGVLSGGSRFFGGQVFSSYGTSSFYQPLYLFYDYIAATNPYRYVSAKEGDGAWEDGAHWVTDIDPNYRIIDANGNVVNGVPDEASDGLNGTEPDFGVVCFDPQGPGPVSFPDACQNLSDGTAYPPARETDGGPEAAPSGVLEGNGNFIGDLTLTGAGETDGLLAVQVSEVSGNPEPRAELAPDFAENAPNAEPLPAPTIANGLPGATGFVPNNVDPDVSTNTRGRYFDVTLSADGTTSLSSGVEIDRLTLTGSGAGLNITSNGSLTSLIDINQWAGTMNVDGTLNSIGDYLIMTGILSGSGTVKAPFVTSVAGGIAPGGMGNAGTLTIDGSLVLSSGNVYLYDVTSSGTDSLQVTGDVSLGGNVALGFSGRAPTFGETFTLVNFDGTASGGFNSASGLGDGVLFGVFSLTETSALLSVEARPYASFLGSGASATQLSYAAALDSARASSYSALSGLYGAVDLLSADDVRTTFDLIAPDEAIAADQAGLALSEALSFRLDSRLRTLRRGDRGFTATASVRAVDIASADGQMGFAAAAGQLASAEATETQTYEMKEGMGGFLTADFFNGDSDTGFQGRSANIDGFAVTAGLDREFAGGTVLGGFFSYAESQADISAGLGNADVDGISVGVYAYQPIGEKGVFIDGYGSYGQYSYDTSRTVTIPGGTSFSTSAETDADQFMVGASLGKVLANESGRTQFTPRVAIDHFSTDIDGVRQQGGPTALNLAGRTLKSTQLSAGGLLEIGLTQTNSVRLTGAADAVFDLDDDVTVIRGQLAGAPGSSPIVLTGPERNEFWVDLQAGVDFDIGSQAVGSIGIKQSVGRDSFEQTTIGANVSVKF